MKEVGAIIGRGCRVNWKRACIYGEGGMRLREGTYWDVRRGVLQGEKRQAGRRKAAFCKQQNVFNGDYNVTMSRRGVMRWATRRYAVTLRRAHYHQTSHTMGGCDGGEGGAWGNVTA